MPNEPIETRAGAEHTAELMEQLMQIARTSALEEMASGFAHELNQPIGAIATFAQTAERMLGRAEPMVDEAREILRHVTTEALKAGSGIHRIRGRFQDQTIPRAECDMVEVLGELEPVLRLLASRSGSRLEIVTAADLPAVLIDRLRIQHVIFTLVQNAIEAPRRASAAPAVAIDISSDRYSVLTSISDTGTGIAPEARGQLFRPFFTTKTAGTGLGLASSRAIVESHEGSIGLEDAPGGGARFWFRLPASSGEATT